MVPWFGFNNTLVLGSLVTALVLLGPMALVLEWGVKKYREKLMTRIQKWRIITLLKGSNLFALYRKLS